MIDDVRNALQFDLITPKAKLQGQPRVHLHTKPYEIAVRTIMDLIDGTALTLIY